MVASVWLGYDDILFYIIELRYSYRIPVANFSLFARNIEVVVLQLLHDLHVIPATLAILILT